MAGWRWMRWCCRYRVDRRVGKGRKTIPGQECIVKPRTSFITDACASEPGEGVLSSRARSKPPPSTHVVHSMSRSTWGLGRVGGNPRARYGMVCYELWKKRRTRGFSLHGVDWIRFCRAGSKRAGLGRRHARPLSSLERGW